VTDSHNHAHAVHIWVSLTDKFSVFTIG